ncbi:MAG TPA: tryptophan--tRNA ligase [Dehalococcoidia bacterium]|nr:tryptophan--tRNA ligase [Dehalococcoidia bacterium]
MDKRKVVFSGVQPSGDPQLGNYLGAFKGWVERQEKKINYFCIVDLHALTVAPDPKELRKQTRELAAILFACGLDPKKTTLFVQSHVAAHAESCWLLNCVTPIGWLERMTQFKDKSQGQERVSAGLLDYPVLMAGDIILYDADEVPVGEDQKQHVELSRDIAARFNRIYGDTFVIPEPVIPEVGGRVMGLNDPGVKMSKSYSHIRGHAIRMLDEPQEIERSFMRAVTDSGNEIRFSDDSEKAGVNNLLSIYKVVTGKPEGEVEKDFESARGYGDLKKAVAEVVIEELSPIRQRYNELISDVTELDKLLAVGSQRAESVSGPKLLEMKDKMGLLLA